MKRSPLVAALAVASTVGVGALGAAPAGAATARHGRIQFSIVSTNPRATSASFIMVGALNAGGRYRPRNARQGVVRFRHGSLVMTSTGTLKGTLDTRTCVGAATGRGTWVINHGTGTFAGVTGHGTYQGAEVFVLPRTAGGACDTAATPTAFQQSYSGSGPVTVP